MGQFSWLDCITKEQVVDNKLRDVYVLVPKEFRKEYGLRIVEHCYDGYGHFGGYDVYDLVADWNREYLAKHPEHYIPGQLTKVSDNSWYKAYADLRKTKDEIVETVEGLYSEWRTIGIEIACYDEDNAALPFPIKITHDANVIYEECEPSPSDPDQGWEAQDY